MGVMGVDGSDGSGWEWMGGLPLDNPIGPIAAFEDEAGLCLEFGD